MTTSWRDRPTFVTSAAGPVGGYVICLARDWMPESQFVRAGFQNCVNTVHGDLEEGLKATIQRYRQFFGPLGGTEMVA